MEQLELQTRYDSRKSFYGKAYYTVSHGIKRLYSYNTLVAKINRKGDVYVDLGYSNTTNRHIKEFLKQQGCFADNTKQIKEDYNKLKGGY